MSNMNIIFMGTPDFAVASLKILVENCYNVVGVITSVDKYGGRGGKVLLESDVKKYAQSVGLNILQPKNLKSPEFIETLRALNADLQIVVAFRMLPEVVWDMPRLGTYNLHGSLLPKYRGAAPINWAVINGETTTGVTSFKLKHAIDTGDIAIQREMPIAYDDNVGDVYNRMKDLGAEVVLETVRLIENGKIELLAQNSNEKSEAPKIYSETCEINFDQSALQVYNFIRGLSPFPTAWTTLHGEKLKIYKASITESDECMTPGTYRSNGKNFLHVECTDGLLSLEEVQISGKKRMKVNDFLNGYNWSYNSQK